MSALNEGGRWFNGPAYTAAQWTTRNPTLLAGEIGYELHPNTSKPWRAKVGPGTWNSLLYFDDLYPYADVVTNPIGDAEGNLQYLTLHAIIKLMLNPYIVPTLSLPVFTINGQPYAQNITLEIGANVNSPAILNAIISDPTNLAVNPYIVDSDDFFSNDGAFAALPANLTIAGGFVNPAVVTDVIIKLKALCTNAEFTNEVQANLGVYPKIIWGCSNAATLIPGDWATLTAQLTSITKDFKKDYVFGVSGYAWLAIPAMLSPANLIFTDVTNPEAPGPYGWQSMGPQTINNGVGTYSYETYRSIYNMTSPSVLRVTIES